jgi:uncharacterized membrane protein
MRNKVVCVGFALGCLASIAIPMPILVRAVIALPMVLFIPGYLIIKIVFPRERFGVELFVFSVGISLAVTVLSGLLLHAASFMTALGWSLLLSGITLTAAFFVKCNSETPPYNVLDLSKFQKFMTAAGCIIALIALYQAREGFLSHNEFSYTELWVVPDKGHDSRNYILGFTNKERRPTDYDIQVYLDGQLLASWPSLRLVDGQTWTERLFLPFKSRSIKEQRVEARLYKTEGSERYSQRVWISIPAERQKPAELTASGDLLDHNVLSSYQRNGDH